MNIERLLSWDTKCFFDDELFTKDSLVSNSDLGFVLLVVAFFIALATVWANIAYR